MKKYEWLIATSYPVIFGALNLGGMFFGGLGGKAFEGKVEQGEVFILLRDGTYKQLLGGDLVIAIALAILFVTATAVGVFGIVYFSIRYGLPLFSSRSKRTHL